MRPDMVNIALDQIDGLLAKYEPILRRNTPFRIAEVDIELAIEGYMAGMAAIERWTGSNSLHATQAKRYAKEFDVHKPGKVLQGVIGILTALRNDIEAGYLVAVEEFLHADMF